MADQKTNPSATAAEMEATVSTEKETHDALADLGPAMPEPMRRLAEKYPEKDPVQKAYKEHHLATDMQKATKAKVKIVEESPDADETPSGYALKKVAGISHDGDRGEQYAREKTARRWGYAPVEDDDR